MRFTVPYPMASVDIRLQLVTFCRRLMAGFALRPPQDTSPCKTYCGVCRGGAEVSFTRWWSPRVKLRRSIRVGAWNVRSLKNGDGPGISLGDGQTEAPGVPAESGRSDAL